MFIVDIFGACARIIPQFRRYGLAEGIVGCRFVSGTQSSPRAGGSAVCPGSNMGKEVKGFCHSCGVCVCVGAVGINSQTLISERARSQCVFGSQCYFLACFRWGITTVPYDSW